MEDAELERVSRLLEQATVPEEIFGDVQGSLTEQLTQTRKIFFYIAKVVHPDLARGEMQVQEAHRAFKKLSALWEQAQAKINAGSYGQRNAFTPFVMQGANGCYTIERVLAWGDLCTIYMGTATSATGSQRVLVKVPMQPRDNDLVANEARVLTHLRASATYDAARHFLSCLVDAFPYEEQTTGIVRQVTVLAAVEGLVSLVEVKKAYPTGIDPKDMAWIWRRLLIALDVAHTNQVIHGSVLPPHILIHPEHHGVVLIDWSYAVIDPSRTGEVIRAINSPYRTWYPAEVLAKHAPQPGLDICMAAQCMIDLLGGDPHRRTMPACVPWQLQSYLQGCTLPNPHRRPQDAHALRETFDELLDQLWGPRVFHRFTLPGS
jgi:hypothetical protein